MNSRGNRGESRGRDRGRYGTNRTLCRFFARGQCRYGDSCHFSHDVSAITTDSNLPNTTIANTSSHPPRRDWHHSLSDFYPPQVAATLAEGLKIIASHDSHAKQSLIKDLSATEKGLNWVRHLVETPFDPGERNHTLSFFTHCVPFLQLIAHDEMLSSLVLEKDVGTLYNVLYGIGGRRGIPLFERATENMHLALMDENTSREKREAAIRAICGAFFGMVNLNQDAAVQKEFKHIATRLEDCLKMCSVQQIESLELRLAARDLQKVKQRLSMGDRIPAVNYETTTVSVPAFQLDVDLPGNLSIKGPRHNNDHENIEDISILPTTEEIKSDRLEFLPLKSKSATHHEEGILRLLDSQFRLLREDTAGQLRDAVCALVKNWDVLVRSNDKKARRNELRRIDARMSIFEHIAAERLRFDKRVGMPVDISFAQPQQVAALGSFSERAAWWRESRDLQFGSLVALVDDAQETTFLQVADREVLKPRSEEELDLIQGGLWTDTGLRDLAYDSNRAMISLSLTNSTSQVDLARIRSIAQQTEIGNAVMVEFPNMLYIAFEPILKCLQALHNKPNVPFTNWLAPSSGEIFKHQFSNEGFVEIPPPLYMAQDGLILDLSCITKDNWPLQFSVANPPSIEELETHTTLDRGQCESFIMTLRNELALVLGPPGTGKSYLGVQLVRALLANRNALEVGPIICITYTNHALDQFLEHVLDSGEENIIRLGSRSQNERLATRTLATVRRGMMRTKVENSNIWHCKQQIEMIESEITMLLERSSRPCSFNDIAHFLQQQFTQIHDSLFAGAKELAAAVGTDGFKTVGAKSRQEIFKLWITGKSRPLKNVAVTQLQSDRNIDELMNHCHDIWLTSRRERLKLKARWEGLINDSRGSDLHALIERFTEQKRLLSMQYKEADKRCLTAAHIIGVTTTGLATNSELLRALPAKVLICEEAAEVLEAHLITALLPSVEHAILIGDHLQLRAQISRYELSMESEQGKKYGLDESLFERLANETFDDARLPIANLDVQRRMHPSIATLVRDTLYHGLQDHPDTHALPEIAGMRKRLFWLNHKNHEDSGANDGPLQTSKSNEWEANMVVSVVRHLSRQGRYRGKHDIAIITPYLGQLRKLRKKFSNVFDLIIGDKDMEIIEAEEEEDGLRLDQQPVVQKGRLIEGLRIATVDNFQGEEAKVIIVSLVRSNNERRCGFLKTSNRINVLLSRAQHGMYIIGDAETCGHVPMWGKVLRILEDWGNIGSNLALHCPRHPDVRIEVSTPEDFVEKSPEGGCSEMCKKRLNCGHTCVVKCHSDALHNAVKCNEDCMRQFVHCEHTCPKRCWQDCGKCRVQIFTNITLPCGHTPSSLACHETVDLAAIKCKQKVVRRLPDCGHEVSVPCYTDMATYSCNQTCTAALPCGHNCQRSCSNCRKRTKLEDGTTSIAVDHGVCKTVCGRPYTTCNHTCEQTCHGEEPCKPCSRPCEVACIHSRCSKRCSEPCPPCAEPCAWYCIHEGRCNMPCAVPCDKIPCSLRCSATLSCGHQCPSICGEECPPADRCHVCATPDIKSRNVDLILMTSYRETEPDNSPLIFLSCGHFYTVETLDGHMGLSAAYNVDPFTGTILGPKPFSQTVMRACPECRAPLRKIHRYNRVVKGALLDEATKRFMAHAGALQTQLLADVEEYETTFEDLAEKFSAITENLTKPAADRKTKQLMQIEAYKRKFQNAIRKVNKFLHAVGRAEQPYGKVSSMVIDVRRRRGIVASAFDLDNTVIQHGFSLRGQSQKLRILWAGLWNFKSLERHIPPEEFVSAWEGFAPALKHAKEVCDALNEAAGASAYYKQVVEAAVYHAQFVALEVHCPAAGDEESKAVAAEMESLEKCVRIIDTHPSTEYLRADVERARVMLNGGKFYTSVSDQEKKAIYEAMAREFMGTGHWYTCVQGHPFTVGECGMPMELARCPECGSPVGGQHHRATEGVRHYQEFERQFGGMRIV